MAFRMLSPLDSFKTDLRTCLVYHYELNAIMCFRVLIRICLPINSASANLKSLISKRVISMSGQFEMVAIEAPEIHVPCE